jgi:hypothetical protein
MSTPTGPINPESFKLDVLYLVDFQTEASKKKAEEALDVYLSTCSQVLAHNIPDTVQKIFDKAVNLVRKIAIEDARYFDFWSLLAKDVFGKDEIEFLYANAHFQAFDAFVDKWTERIPAFRNWMDKSEKSGKPTPVEKIVAEFSRDRRETRVIEGKTYVVTQFLEDLHVKEPNSGDYQFIKASTKYVRNAKRLLKETSSDKGQKKVDSFGRKITVIKTKIDGMYLATQMVDQGLKPVKRSYLLIEDVVLESLIEGRLADKKSSEIAPSIAQPQE